MSKKTVKCLVTGHSNGPLCDSCNKPMDSVEVQSTGKLKGAKGHYCYYCTNKE